MEDREYFRDSEWNKTDFTYTFSTGCKLEFFSVDQAGKVRGPRRDVLFINEANNISKEVFDQLEVRTRKIIWLDWNPVNEFWFYTDLKDTRKDIDFLTLTYKDNEALDKSIVDTIEARRPNKAWFQVYGLGQLGEVEGRIYTGWQIIEKLPFESRLWRYGLDFGYSNDPAALVAVYEINGGLVLDEIFYQKGMSNKDIADNFKNIERTLVIADSSEPKSIDEIKGYGINILPCEKGRDSITHGIQYVQDKKISVTQRSLNILKEYRNYMWITDKDGKIINEPSDIMNHAMDALRYAIASGNHASWKPRDPGGIKPLIAGMNV